MGGQSGTQAESFRAMQKLEIRINYGRYSCVDDVKVDRFFFVLKPVFRLFQDTQAVI